MNSNQTPTKKSDVLTHTPITNLNIDGCACRCLLQIQSKKQPISEGDFIACFSGTFPIWQTQPGLTDTRAICHIARSLGLAESIHVFRDYDRIKRYFGQAAVSGILIGVERWPNQNSQLLRCDHCTLLLSIDDSHFQLWCPNQDGSAKVWDFNREDWDKLVCHAIVLT